MKLIRRLEKKDNVKMGVFECVCGKQIKRSMSNGLKQKHCKECGNAEISKKNKKNKTTHGGRYTRLYRIWRGIKSRCLNKNNKDFGRWGGDGVKICDEWREDFVAFRDWSLLNGYSEELSIDKDILSKKLSISPPQYSPSTCMWVNKADQARNQKSSVINKVIADEIREYYQKHGIARTVDNFKDVCSKSVCSNVVYGKQWM